MQKQSWALIRGLRCPLLCVGTCFQVFLVFRVHAVTDDVSSIGDEASDFAAFLVTSVPSFLLFPAIMLVAVTSLAWSTVIFIQLFTSRETSRTIDNVATNFGSYYLRAAN